MTVQTVTAHANIWHTVRGREAERKAEERQRKSTIATTTCLRYLVFLFLFLLMAWNVEGQKGERWNEMKENT